jgi:cysteine desulfurase
MNRTIYADHAATTPLAPEVLVAMMPYLTEYYGNASSPHAMGQASQIAVDRARDEVAAVFGCTSAEVIFTGGGSEGDNLASQRGGVSIPAGAWHGPRGSECH